MATGSALLEPGSAVLPDGSASNLAAGRVTTKSSGTAPGVYTTKLLFDAAQLEWAVWKIILPANYSSSPVLVINFSMVSATSGNVILVARVAAITPGTDNTDTDAKVFSTANTSAATAVRSTAGYQTQVSITLTNADSMAAGDTVWLYVGRDGASGSDTAAGDLEFLGARLDYTTA